MKVTSSNLGDCAQQSSKLITPSNPQYPVNYVHCVSFAPGDLTRLRQVIARAKAGSPVRVVVLGGSVTNGGACESYALSQSKKGSFGPCSWSNRFVIWIQKQTKNAQVKLISLAQPATTSAWRLAHFDEVLAAKPDLLLVDYGVNDPNFGDTPDRKTQYAGMMRATTERLVRRFLERTENAAHKPAIMYLAVQRSFENSTYAFASDVYYPVCSTYGVPVVSVHDAIWPVIDKPRPLLWETKAGAHPIWSGHQLITDLMAFAWTAADAGVDEYPSSGNDPQVKLPVPFRSPDGPIIGSPLLFASSGNSELETCTDGSYLSTPHDSFEWLKPSRSDGTTRGWKWADHNGKVGWEYDTKADLVNFERKSVRNQRRQLRFTRRPGKGYLHPALAAAPTSAATLSVASNHSSASVPDVSNSEHSAQFKLTPLSSSFSRQIKDLTYQMEKKDVDGIERSVVAADDLLLTSDNFFEGRFSPSENTEFNELWEQHLSLAALRDDAALALNKLCPLPTVPAAMVKSLPGIISFPVRFNATRQPGILVEFLRSYQNYGQAVMFITANMDGMAPHIQAGSMENTSSSASSMPLYVPPTYEELEKYAIDMLRLAWVDRRFEGVCKRELANELIKKTRSTNYSPDCSMINAGTWQDPAVLDGFWPERSSQVAIGARHGSLSVQQDRHIPGHPWRTVVDAERSILVPADLSTDFAPHLGRKSTTTGNITDESDGKGDIAHDSKMEFIGVVDGEVHFMMVPWSSNGSPDRTKFKISGLSSC